jgi:transcriptional regulator with XRE-family HTH domain
MLESGKRKNPSLDVLKKLAKALGVPVAELLE